MSLTSQLYIYRLTAMPRRPSRRTMQVLQMFLIEPERWLHGYDLIKELDIASGTLYPILMRLHDRGVLATRWEESPMEGRPPRHMYRLTGDGQRWVRTVLADTPFSGRLQPWEGMA